MTTNTIYSITQDFNELLELRALALEANDNQQIEMIDQALSINHDNFREKSLNYVKFMRSEELSIDAIDSEIDRLTAIKKAKTNKIKSLKDRLSNAMQFLGIDKYDLTLFNLSFRKSESVEVLEVELLDDEFKRSKTVVEADKTAIKKAIKDGRQVAGATIKESISLQVK